MSEAKATFYLEMANWNVPAAVGYYFDLENTNESSAKESLPSMTFVADKPGTQRKLLNCCVKAKVPEASTVTIDQMASPKNAPVGVASLHWDSYIPGSVGDVI